MDAERTRAFLLSLTDVVETAQWGGLVFWVGDKAIGGKMFAMLNLEGGGQPPISYPAGAERFAELIELDGIEPAAYLARLHWISALRWNLFRRTEWEAELHAAHALTLLKLAPKTRKVLALPKTEQRRVVLERRKTLAEQMALKAERMALKQSTARS